MWPRGSVRPFPGEVHLFYREETGDREEINFLNRERWASEKIQTHGFLLLFFMLFRQQISSAIALMYRYQTVHMQDALPENVFYAGRERCGYSSVSLTWKEREVGCPR